MALAHRWGGTVKAFLSAAGCLGTLAVMDGARRLGQWTRFRLAVHPAPPTSCAVGCPCRRCWRLGTGQIGILLGLGDHTTAVLSLTRAMGVGPSPILVTWLLLAVLRGRLHPVGGLGVAWATVLLFPVVQPWYPAVGHHPAGLLGHPPRFRIATIAVTLVVGIFGPPRTATGSRCSRSSTPLSSALIVAGSMPAIGGDPAPTSVTAARTST